jgi:hypothetical protein
VLLRHILETPPHGRARIDLHLGQKPKLGGEVRRWFTHLYIIFCRYFVYPCFTFFPFFVVLVLISTFQNTKRPKIFPLFLFVCLFSSLALVCFGFYFWFDISKVQKDFALFAVSFCSCFKIKKNPKIFVVLFLFCKVCCRVQSPVTPLELGYHFILFKPHKWKAIMMTYDNSRGGERLVWTLFVFIFVHILIYVDVLSLFM